MYMMFVKYVCCKVSHFLYSTFLFLFSIYFVLQPEKACYTFSLKYVAMSFLLHYSNMFSIPLLNLVYTSF